MNRGFAVYIGYKPTIWVLENAGISKFLGGAFSCNTREKYAAVHKGIPMVYFGNYVCRQYVYGVVI